MKLKAKIVPYSSVVGGGLTLLEDGIPIFMVMLCGTTKGITREQDQAVAERLVSLINEHGLEVPSHD